MNSPDDHPALSELRAALLAWYDRNARELPWRGTSASPPDPYAVWVSEVMLQQTRVEAVKPYFARWMDRFPTVRDLAEAPLGEVLKEWEGLGYYSRARNLHRAAREVGHRHGGDVPAETAAFRALPGVGRYTAGAVMSIAFGHAEAVVDGNIRRVFARLTDAPEPVDRELWTMADGLVPGERPGDLNQALMELGATICTPRSPRCGECPIRPHCAAARAGTQRERPLPRRRRPLPHEPTAVGVVAREGRLLIARRRVDARLGGMWELPAAVRRAGEPLEAAAVRALGAGVGLDAGVVSEIGAVDHTFTHVRVTYHAMLCSADGNPRAITYDEVAWAGPEELARYPLPAAQKRLTALAFAAVGSAG